MRAEKEHRVGTALAAGMSAPQFELHSTPDQLVSLLDFRGTPLILAFYDGILAALEVVEMKTEGRMRTHFSSKLILPVSERDHI